MTDAEFDLWAERKSATFDQWVFANFVPVTGRRATFKARKVRSRAAWAGLMAETPWLFSQHNGGRVFEFSSDDFNTEHGEQNCLFVFARFVAPDGQRYEPTEGMVIECDTGEMSYC